MIPPLWYLHGRGTVFGEDEQRVASIEVELLVVGSSTR